MTGSEQTHLSNWYLFNVVYREKGEITVPPEPRFVLLFSTVYSLEVFLSMERTACVSRRSKTIGVSSEAWHAGAETSNCQPRMEALSSSSLSSSLNLNDQSFCSAL